MKPSSILFKLIKCIYILARQNQFMLRSLACAMDRFLTKPPRGFSRSNIYRKAKVATVNMRSVVFGAATSRLECNTGVTVVGMDGSIEEEIVAQLTSDDAPLPPVDMDETTAEDASKELTSHTAPQQANDLKEIVEEYSVTEGSYALRYSYEYFIHNYQMSLVSCVRQIRIWKLPK